MQPRISSCTVAKTYSEMHIRIHWRVRTGHAQTLNCFPICLHSCLRKYLSYVHCNCWLCDPVFLAERHAEIHEIYPDLLTQLFVQIFIMMVGNVQLCFIQAAPLAKRLARGCTIRKQTLNLECSRCSFSSPRSN